MAYFEKDPDAVLPFSVDWTAWAAQEDDTITSATWSATGDVVVEGSPAPGLIDSVATVWLSGGTAGKTAKVTCHVVTAGGREDDRTLTISVYQR